MEKKSYNCSDPLHMSSQIPAQDGYIHYDLWIHGFLNSTVPESQQQTVPTPLPAELRFGEAPKSGHSNSLDNTADVF